MFLTWRRLWSTPLFTLFAIGIIALGIGATTATFSLVNAVLFRPLPYSDADRIVFVWQASDTPERERQSVSFPNFEDWRRQARSFESLVAFSQPSFTLGHGDAVERIEGELVSAGYFRLVKVPPAFGRGFLPQEDRALGASPVAVISDTLWHRSFGADPALLGRPIKVNGRDLTVIGIMPKGFRGITGQADLWVPMMMMREAIPDIAGIDPTHRREVGWFAVLGRLRPGVTAGQAEAEMVAIARRLEQTYPSTNDGVSALVVPLDEQLLGGVRPLAVLLLGAVAVVLLIACANLASLLLAKGITRQQEVAVRSALGASRRQLALQLFRENLLLALLGGGIGILLAFLGLSGLEQALAGEIPSFLEVSFDGRVLVFAVLLSLLTGTAFGLLPALEGTRTNLESLLRSDSRASTPPRGRSRSRFLLLTGEIAVALALIAGAGLFLQAIRQIGRLDLGFQTASRLTLRVDLPGGEYSPQELIVFAHELEQRVAALPGVQSVTVTSDLPLGDRQLVGRVYLEEAAPGKSEAGIKVFQHAVVPGFFRALEIPLLAGRDVGPEDRQGSPRVVVLSKSMADRYWPDESPLGQRIRLATLESRNNWVTVVGIVGDVRFRSLAQDPNQDFDVYVPFSQAPSGSLGLVVQTASGATGIAGAIRRTVQSFRPDLTIYEIATLEERVAQEASGSRISAMATTLCAFLALGLAMFGLYASLTYSASQRTREMGIRLALGAQRTDLVRLGLAEGLRVAAAGVVVGLVLAFLTLKVLKGLLAGIQTSDPTALLGGVALVIATSLLVSLLSTRRVVRVDPVTAIREP